MSSTNNLQEEEADALWRNESRAVKTIEFFTDGVYPALIRILTGALIVALCLWIVAGVGNVLFRLKDVFAQNWARNADLDEGAHSGRPGQSRRGIEASATAGHDNGPFIDTRFCNRVCHDLPE